MATVIDAPQGALLAGLVLAICYVRVRHAWVLAAALGWLGYAGYEWGIHQRWLCNGDCAIRAELVVIYPLLFLLTFAAIVVIVKKLTRRVPARPVARKPVQQGSR